jgi:hypothetical protein
MVVPPGVAVDSALFSSWANERAGNHSIFNDLPSNIMRKGVGKLAFVPLQSDLPRKKTGRQRMQMSFR